MEKISKIISKKVISLEDATQVGYVVNVIFDDRIKNFTGLIIIDDESENSFVLNKEDIYSMGDDTVMIKSANCLQYNISSNSNNPVGKTVYDSYGNCLGRVCDVELHGKVVKKIITNLCEFPQKFIRKSGDNFIIFGTYKKEKDKDRPFNETIKKVDASSMPQVVIAQSISSEAVVPEVPTRVFVNSQSLIGKIVTSELLGYNNELIAKKNDVINNKIIGKAKAHNKLMLLNYYSK